MDIQPDVFGNLIFTFFSPAFPETAFARGAEQKEDELKIRKSSLTSAALKADNNKANNAKILI